MDRGRAAPSAKGALGISNRTDPDNVGERRTTTKAPPALILRAVANSNRSLPFSSRLLTNTGIERGNRTHLRRSFSGWRRFKDSPRGQNSYLFHGTSWAKLQEFEQRTSPDRPESPVPLGNDARA